MESRSYIFAVPDVEGEFDCLVPSWTETPKGCIIQLIGTDNTNGYDNDSVMSFGVIDSAGGEYNVAATEMDAEATANGGRTHYSDCLGMAGEDGDGSWFWGNFVSWEVGGVKIDFQGYLDTIYGTNSLLITFFSGTDVSTKAGNVAQNAGDITSVGFLSKMIFTGTVGWDITDGYEPEALFSLGVVTNGTNGLTQNYIGWGSKDTETTTKVCSNLGTGHASAEVHNDAVAWEGTVSAIDSSGFTISSTSGTDEFVYLCMTFDNDVDSGYSTVPTTGDISITDPGFTPQIVGTIISNLTAIDTLDTSTSDQIIGSGAVDAVSENSVTASTEDGVGDSNCTSVHSTSVLHVEDADQTEILDASLDAFTSSGFDLTVNTHPSTATYYIWWAIEEAEEPDPGDIEVRSYMFDVPTSSGDHSFTVPAWSSTPKAASFVLINTGETDGYDDASAIGVGFTDGTTEGNESTSFLDAVGTTDTYRSSDTTGVVWPAALDLYASFSAWESGGVELTWGGTDLAEWGGYGMQVMVTFFAGTDLEVDCFWASPGDHVESLSFTSKLILAACTGQTAGGTSDWGNLAIGVCTNGTNGLFQGLVEHNNNDAVTTTELGSGIEDGSIAGQYDGSWNWISAISNIDSVGFNLSDSDTDEILFLAMNFDADVDGGVGTVPTSGDISITDPGFTPSFACVFGSNNDAEGAWDSAIDPNGMWIGTYDGTSENCVGVTGEDFVGTSNQTSVHSSDIIHFEDADQSVEFNASFDAFTSSGFDITVNTQAPTQAVPFLWFAIEATESGAALAGDIVGTSSTTGDIEGDAEFAGDITGTSSTTGDIEGTADFAGDITASSSTTGDIYGSASLDGDITGTSSTLTDLTGTAAFAGDITGTSSTTGDIYGEVPIAGDITGDSSTTGDIRAVAFLAGDVDGVSSTTGDLVGEAEIAGDITGTSSTTGDLDMLFPFAGDITGTSSTTGDIYGEAEIAGDVTGDSSTTGDLVGEAEIAGDIVGTSSTTGDVTIDFGFAGDIVGTSSTTGDLSHDAPLAGDIDGVSSTTGDLVGESAFSGDITADSSTTGDLVGEAEISGDSIGTSATTGDLLMLLPFAGDIVGTSSTTGDLVGDAELAGDVTGDSATTGDIYGEAELAGDVTGESSTTGDIYGEVPLAGDVTGESSTTGDLTVSSGALAGDIVGISSITGDLGRITSLEGVAAGTSSTTGDFYATASFSGDIVGTSSTDADMGGIAGAAGDIIGTSVTYADLLGDLSMSGAITGVSSTTGDLVGYAEIAGDIVGTSFASLGGVIALVGDIWELFIGDKAWTFVVKEDVIAVSAVEPIIDEVIKEDQLTGYIDDELEVDPLELTVL